MDLHINQARSHGSLKDAIYTGAIFLETQLKTAQQLRELAKDSITRELGQDTDSRLLHTLMPVKEFVQVVSRIKGQFTNSAQAKEIIRDFIVELGENPADYLFDVPRLRVVPHYDYLHAGVSYAYKPHRDTWYGSVQCQLNTWMPVYGVTPDTTMSINPEYFSVPVKNSSVDWHLADWINNERWKASQSLNEEARVHPVPLEDIKSSNELRIGLNGGEMIVFSGAHLHGTVPNRSGQTRFSIDFRLMHIEDLKAGRGAINVDNGCPDPEAGFKDYFYAGNFDRFQEISA
ncbi:MULTISPECIES: 2OG-Fe(II) oxygenase family protein [Paraburkholderia]|uniref:hypothetical protein n=1 Tax=Paraburkholderia TaxID=1822464 RepID=UPI001CB448E8|nr:hypothetical protein [Paraburkholderia caribensis]CAG9244847.1 conserved hypothetical protein [Paraburkholderia caribensis]